MFQVSVGSCKRCSSVVHLSKPQEVLGDGGGAALDLHQWDLIFCRHQDVVLVVENSCQVHAPNNTDIGNLYFCKSLILK